MRRVGHPLTASTLPDYWRRQLRWRVQEYRMPIGTDSVPNLDMFEQFLTGREGNETSLALAVRFVLVQRCVRSMSQIVGLYRDLDDERPGGVGIYLLREEACYSVFNAVRPRPWFQSCSGGSRRQASPAKSSAAQPPVFASQPPKSGSCKAQVVSCPQKRLRRPAAIHAGPGPAQYLLRLAHPDYHFRQDTA